MQCMTEIGLFMQKRVKTPPKKQAYEKNQIQQLLAQFEQACYIYNDIECCSARELQSIFNYAEWRNFIKVIDKAQETCKQSGNEVADHFVDVTKMIIIEK